MMLPHFGPCMRVRGKKRIQTKRLHGFIHRNDGAGCCIHPDAHDLFRRNAAFSHQRRNHRLQRIHIVGRMLQIPAGRQGRTIRQRCIHHAVRIDKGFLCMDGSVSNIRQNTPAGKGTVVQSNGIKAVMQRGIQHKNAPFRSVRRVTAKKARFLPAPAFKRLQTN